MKKSSEMYCKIIGINVYFFCTIAGEASDSVSIVNSKPSWSHGILRAAPARSCTNLDPHPARMHSRTMENIIVSQYSKLKLWIRNLLWEKTVCFRICNRIYGVITKPYYIPNPLIRGKNGNDRRHHFFYFLSKLLLENTKWRNAELYCHFPKNWILI